MSTDVYARGLVREIKIWQVRFFDLFAYSPEAMEDRTFGLMSDQYRRGFAIIRDGELIATNRLLDSLTQSLAALDLELTLFQQELTGKRAVKYYEFQVRQGKLQVKAWSNQIAGELMEAKIAALDQDRQEIITRQRALALVIDKAVVEIADLNAKIRLEELNQEEAELEKVRAELRVVEGDFKIMEATLKALRIELQVTETLLAIANINAEKITTLADIKSMDADIIRTTLSQYHLTAEQRMLAANLDAVARGLGVDLMRITEKYGLLTDEEADLRFYLQTLADWLISEMAAIQVRLASQKLLEAAEVVAEGTQTGTITQDSTARQSMATASGATDTYLAAKATLVPQAHILGVQNETQAEIDAATTMAMAKVTSELTHVIASA